MVLDDAARAAVLADYQAGIPVREVARRHNTSTATVGRIARAAGASSTRADVAVAATATATATAAAKRAALSVALLDDAERHRAASWENVTTREWSRGLEEWVEVEQLPTAKEREHIMRTVVLAATQHLALEKADGTDGTVDASNMLAATLTAIRAHVDAVDPPAPTVDQ